MAIPFTRAPNRLLSISDLDATGVSELLEHAAALKAGRSPATGGASLAGRSVALIFEKPSLRTRVSFEVGIARLGGTPIVLHGEEVGLGSRESARDVARTLERYVDLIVARVFDHALLEELAGYAVVPVVNALSDVEHPCQALADLLALKEHWGVLAGRQLVYVGDGNNVAASLLLAGASVGMHVRVVSPAGYGPDDGIVARARAIGRVQRRPHRGRRGSGGRCARRRRRLHGCLGEHGPGGRSRAAPRGLPALCHHLAAAGRGPDARW